MILTDHQLVDWELQLSRIARACRSARPGSVMVQLRDRELPVRERLGRGQQLRQLTRETGQWLAVNDRLDLALVLEADALHLGEGSVPAAAVRQVLGSRLWLSRACHDPAKAHADGADAVLLSPVAQARKGRPALGLAGLRRALETPQAPLVFALGGIDADWAARCVAAGARGVAVIGSVVAREDAGELLSALRISGSSS